MNLKRAIILLFLSSGIIYGLQLLIFRDPNTTSFYIFQDVAFLPISIAVATLVVGEYLSYRDKKERKQKTQMIASAFFTELGTPMLMELLPMVADRNPLKSVFRNNPIEDEGSLAKLRKELQDCPLELTLTAERYEKVQQMICARHESMMIIASNPLLLDHEEFTDLLWAIFHMTDEYQLRGPFEKMGNGDVAHLAHDFEELTRLLLVNWANNLLYTKETYPNYYNAKMIKILEAAENVA